MERKCRCNQQKRSHIARVAEALSQLIQDQAPDAAYLDNGNGSVTYYRGL